MTEKLIALPELHGRLRVSKASSVLSYHNNQARLTELRRKRHIVYISNQNKIQQNITKC